MSLQYEIKVDDRAVKLKFDKLVQKTPALSRLILGRLSEAVISESVKTYLSGKGSSLGRQTGTLAKSLNYRLLNDWSAEIGTNVKYAAIHEFGGTIRPKNAEYLHFKVGDDKWGGSSWVRTKEVRMPARPYLGPALDKVFNSQQAQRIMDRTVEDYFINRVWER